MIKPRVTYSNTKCQIDGEARGGLEDGRKNRLLNYHLLMSIIEYVVEIKSNTNKQEQY